MQLSNLHRHAGSQRKQNIQVNQGIKAIQHSSYPNPNQGTGLNHQDDLKEFTQTELSIIHGVNQQSKNLN